MVHMKLPVKELWERYQRTRRVEDRNALVEHYTHLVTFQARRLSFKIPQQVTYEELWSAGAGGLIGAVEDFDPRREATFETFSFRRIIGAITDWLRSVDPQSRKVRTFERRRIEAANQLQCELGRTAQEEEVVERMGVPDERYTELERISKMGKQIPLSELTTSGERKGKEDGRALELPDHKQEDPSGRLARQMLTEYITRGLSRQEQLLLKLYYYEELTMAEIGQVLDLSESRISQMHKDLLARLRERFENARYEELAA